MPIEKALISNIIRDAGIPRGSFYQYFEDIDDAYYYVINEEDYLKDVLTLYTDESLLKKYNNQARIQAEHCSSSSYADAVLVVYNRAILDKQEEDRYGLISKITKKIRGK